MASYNWATRVVLLYLYHYIQGVVRLGFNSCSNYFVHIIIQRIMQLGFKSCSNYCIPIIIHRIMHLGFKNCSNYCIPIIIFMATRRCWNEHCSGETNRSLHAKTIKQSERSMTADLKDLTLKAARHWVANLILCIVQSERGCSTLRQALMVGQQEEV